MAQQPAARKPAASVGWRTAGAALLVALAATLHKPALLGGTPPAAAPPAGALATAHRAHDALNTYSLHAMRPALRVLPAGDEAAAAAAAGHALAAVLDVTLQLDDVERHMPVLTVSHTDGVTHNLVDSRALLKNWALLQQHVAAETAGAPQPMYASPAWALATASAFFPGDRDMAALIASASRAGAKLARPAPTSALLLVPGAPVAAVADIMGVTLVPSGDAVTLRLHVVEDPHMVSELAAHNTQTLDTAAHYHLVPPAGVEVDARRFLEMAEASGPLEELHLFAKGLITTIINGNGDPHLQGFNGHKYSWCSNDNGAHCLGRVFNVISESLHVFNTRLTRFAGPDVWPYAGAWMTAYGFRYGDALSVELELATDVVYKLRTEARAEDPSLEVTRAVLPGGWAGAISSLRVNGEDAARHVGSGDTLVFGEGASKASVHFPKGRHPNDPTDGPVVVISTPDMQVTFYLESEDTTHLDFAITMLDNGITDMHGVLGQSVAWPRAGPALMEGSDLDYVVEGGLLADGGKDYAFNRFTGRRAAATRALLGAAPAPARTTAKSHWQRAAPRA
ncbi:MAG: hypothetical protein J3K34DRAFT_134260 [Monoraphidium minutum]|nr:MAG: hypothetical protein J3K34DRAFT_134260 [Monoraphidium minutum]